MNYIEKYVLLAGGLEVSFSIYGNTRDTSVMHEKAKCVCFNCTQPQKVKFKSVQINMKHVS